MTGDPGGADGPRRAGNLNSVSPYSTILVLMGVTRAHLFICPLANCRSLLSIPQEDQPRDQLEELSPGKFLPRHEGLRSGAMPVV